MSTLFSQIVWLSIGFIKKTRTCAIMELEAREVPKQEYASNSTEQVCLSNATEETDNTCNQGDIRNRMQSKQTLRGGGGGPPQGPHIR